MRQTGELSGRFFLCFISVLCFFVFNSLVFAATDQGKFRYVINVDLANKLRQPTLGDFQEKYRIYHVKLKIKNKMLYRTRLGFFDNRKKARQVLAEVKKKYKSAWLDTVKQYDKTYLQAWFRRHKSTNKVTSRSSAFLLNKKETTNVMKKARQSVVKQDYPSAIKFYTKVLSRGAVKYRQDAQEYLGVTREKNGQYAHAKAEYQKYLRLYPKGEGAERVKSRLEGMLTALKVPRRKLAKAKSSKKTIWQTYGYMTEFYRYDKLSENDITRERSSSTTSLGVFARRRSDTSNLKLQMTGSYLHDFNDSNDNRRRLTSLYMDYANKPKTTSVRLGRQNHYRSGVLGRMDGIWADYQLHPQLKVNFVAGHPVNLFQTNNIQEDRKFQGVSLDIGTFNKYLDFNIFKIEQEVDGITDREAVGGEIRYISPKYVYFTLLDYDTYFEEMNKIYVVSTWRFEGQNTLNVTYDKSKSPYMLITNALQGQPFLSVEQMRGSFSDEEIKKIANDRTAESTTTTISGSAHLSKKYSLYMDVTRSILSGTPASAGVPGTESTGGEMFYGVQLIGNNVWMKGGTMVSGVRYSDTNTYKRASFSISERLVLKKKWRTNFSFYYALTDRSNGAESEAIKPSVGLDYLYSRSLKLETDFIYEKFSTKGDTLPTEGEGVNFSLGLVYEF